MPAGRKRANKGMEISLKACHCGERSDAAISWAVKNEILKRVQDDRVEDPAKDRTSCGWIYKGTIIFT